MIEKERLAFCTGVSFTGSAEQADLPSDILLLRFGLNEFTKGNSRGNFDFTRSDAENVVRDFAVRGRDLVIDYEHQSLSGEKAPAAGWIDRISITADGLMAHVKYWTAEAAQYLNNGEYRYFSPTLYFSRSGKSVSSIHSVALTNHPALHSIPALAADDSAAVEDSVGTAAITDTHDSEGEPESVTEKREMLSDLLQCRDELESFLTGHGFKSLADAAKCLDDLHAQLNGMHAEKLVAQAFRDGKLMEAERSWADDFARRDPGAFCSWCQGAPRRIPDNCGTADRPDCYADKMPDGQEENIFKMLGLDPRKIKQEQEI